MAEAFRQGIAASAVPMAAINTGELQPHHSRHSFLHACRLCMTTCACSVRNKHLEIQLLLLSMSYSRALRAYSSLK
jgi:hypothetical protein